MFVKSLICFSHDWFAPSSSSCSERHLALEKWSERKQMNADASAKTLKNLLVVADDLLPFRRD